MPSPRRSARTTNPLHPTKSTDSNSSSSSLSSARPERSTRSHNKSSPSPKSASPNSLSDPEAVGSTRDMAAAPQTRRSTRAHNPADQDQDNKTDNDVDAEIEGGDEEVTRCVCGHQDYPGPPLTDDSASPSDQSEDAGGLFIQCDKCHVWQHGGCVGIMDESKSPENYFCELCDGRLHNVMTDSRGQQYSRYLPLFPSESKSARKESISSKDAGSKNRKERDTVSRASVDSALAKRRSTMNSRNAYDEEETLRRVIEESRGENEPTPSAVSSRKAKRVREDSEETKQEIKRQRTSSNSSLPPPTKPLSVSIEAESDDETGSTRMASNGSKKAKSAAAESHRQKEMREREKLKEQQRVEHANRRKERAGRRRGEDSEPIEETPRPIATPLPPVSQPPSPPTSAPAPAPPGSSHKKGASRKPKRLGRNQYTKDRDLPAKPATSPQRLKSQRFPQNSSGDEPSTVGNGEALSTGTSKNSPSSTTEPSMPIKPKVGKWKGKNPRLPVVDGEPGKEREKDGMSLGDMKKRAGLMMDYIAKAQMDMAGERSPNPLMLSSIGVPVQSPANGVNRDFRDLTSREMMESLSTQISAWQTEYGENAPVVS